MLIFYSLVFIFGLIIGSSLNCFIYRLEKNDSLKGRSYCPNCKHNLNWLDLIPILSYLSLGGKCRYCRKNISIQYPIVEISTALMFLLVFRYQLFDFEFSFFYILFSIFSIYIVSSLILIFVYDLKHYLIPDEVLFPAIILTFLYQLFFLSQQDIPKADFIFLFLNSLWASLIAFLFFGIIFWMSRGKWMGFGDCKLVILLGLLLGLPNILVCLFLSFFFGAIIGLSSIFLSFVVSSRKKMELNSQIPFAPFLILGFFVSMFWGSEILDWYFRFFLI